MTIRFMKHRRAGGRARQLVADYRRQTILSAARAVFARRGFAGASMDLVAREADVAKGTLYLYYRSKSALYSAAVISGLEDLARETVRVVGSGHPLREVLAAFFEMRQRYFEENADFFRIYSAEIGALGTAVARIRRAVVRLHEHQIEALEQAITAAVRVGDVRHLDARAVALTVFDLSHGGIMRRIRQSDDERMPDVQAVVELLWKGLAR